MAPSHALAVDEAHRQHLADVSLWRMLHKSGAAESEHAAIISHYQPQHTLEALLPIELRSVRPGNVLSWTFQQLSAAAQRLGIHLRERGLSDGATLLCLENNSLEWAVTFWACAFMHVAFVPVNPQVAHRPREFQHILDIVRPKCIVIRDARDADYLDNYRQDDPSHVLKLCLRGIVPSSDKTGSGQWTDLDTFLAGPRKSHEHDDRVNEACDTATPALILFTSGTTSLPKACPHTAMNLQSQTDGFAYARKYQPHSNALVGGPTFHIQAVWNVLMAWRGGATVIFPARRMTADSAVQCLNEYRCTHFSCSTAIVQEIASHRNLSPDGYPSLEVLAVGADFVSASIAQKCQDVFRAKRFINGWGMSEGIGILGLLPDELPRWYNGYLTVGRAMPGNAVRVCSPVSEEPVQRGEVGELHVSSPSVIKGYLQCQGAVSSESNSINDTQWTKTGDAVIMDNDGYIYMISRYKDLIIRGGENISPAVMEQCLNVIPGVKVFNARKYQSGIQLTTHSFKSSV